METKQLGSIPDPHYYLMTFEVDEDGTFYVLAWAYGTRYVLAKYTKDGEFWMSED
jgi:hypothetical protein